MNIFTITMTPMSPPHDDGPKNIAIALARRLVMHRFCFISSVKSSFANYDNVVFVKSPFQTTGKHRMSFFQKIFIFFFIISHMKEIDLFQFFFTPRPYFSIVFKRLLKKNKKRSIQIVSSIHTLLSKNQEKSVASLFFADYVVVHSDYARNVLVKNGVNNVIRIYPGIDRERFDRAASVSMANTQLVAPGGTNIIYPGTYKILNDSYSFHEFCKIAFSVKQQIPEVRFIMACRIRTKEDVYLEKRFKSLIIKEGLMDIFTLLNTVCDIPSLFGKSSAGIMPASRPMTGILEIPLVLLELAVLEKPVIYGDVPPLDELDRKGLGIRNLDGSTESYAKILVKCLRDRDFSLEVGLRSREAVINNFTMDIAGGEYQKLYKGLQN